MHVLFCTMNYPPGPMGGAEHQARLQAERLAAIGHRVTVVCPAGAYSGTSTVKGVHIRRLAVIRRRPFTRASYLLRLVLHLAARGASYDIVHVHEASAHADAAYVGRLLRRTPLYIKLASGGATGEIEGRRRRRTGVLRWRTLERAGRVQALSAQIERELSELAVRPDRIIRLPNGVSSEEFSPVTSRYAVALRAELDLPVHKTVVLYVGRFAAWKGPDDLVSAWRMLGSRNSYLVMVGTYATEHAINPIEPTPTLAVRPWADRPAAYLNAADIYVHPAHSDGMSNAVLEAMACGLPIIASASPAAEGFLSTDDAELFTSGDAAGLAASLERVICDGAYRAQLAARSQARAKEFELATVVDQIVYEYRRLLAR